MTPTVRATVQPRETKTIADFLFSRNSCTFLRLNGLEATPDHDGTAFRLPTHNWSRDSQRIQVNLAKTILPGANQKLPFSRLLRPFSTSQLARQTEKERLCTTTEPGTNINVPSKKIVTPLPPLTDPLPGTENVQYASVTTSGAGAQVTTLANGLRVASEQRFGQFCTVGVVIDSGPRYEVAYPSGVSHFLEKLAFHVSNKQLSKNVIYNSYLAVDIRISGKGQNSPGTGETRRNL